MPVSVRPDKSHCAHDPDVVYILESTRICAEAVDAINAAQAKPKTYLFKRSLIAANYTAEIHEV